MNEIRQFISVHFNEIKIKCNKVTTIEEAYEHLLNTSLFHIRETPNVFDWNRYLNTYPDLKKALHNCHDVVWHYLLYGIRERRKAYIVNSFPKCIVFHILLILFIKLSNLNKNKLSKS